MCPINTISVCKTWHNGVQVDNLNTRMAVIQDNTVIYLTLA